MIKRLGIDIGSLFLSSVLLDDDRILEADYVELKGDVTGALNTVQRLVSLHKPERVGITGSFPRLHGILDNTLCVLQGAHFLLPESRNVLSVGGQSFLVIFFDEQGRYREHSLNPPCAAGTGSFLEQQAERLGLAVSELSERAKQYGGKVPTIATRCAVFAKSDIIHSMQEGYSVEAICAGLCEGIARNVVDTLIKGRQLSAPVGLVGGVAQNSKVVETLQRLLGLPVVVPERAWAAGALGAAFLAEQPEIDTALLQKLGRTQRAQRPPLALRLSSYPDFGTPDRVGEVEVLFNDNSALSSSQDLVLGIDIGSTSTKAVVLNERNEVVAGFYTATKGEPVAAVQKLLEVLRAKDPSWSGRLRQAATTGSGRKMIKELFQADLEVNEITAHARAATFLHPQVDTVIEIGGQDSKFLRLKNGEVVYSTMNYVCAAGTGSFIEEQAKRLGVTLEEYSALALGQAGPYTSDRCTVYMERDLNRLLTEGWAREAVLASVLFSVRDNYLSKVVNRHPLGSEVVFQGATARNKALVAAFEQYLNRPVHVSPYCHLAGALGVALLARETGQKQSRFRTQETNFRVEQELCELCTNRCELKIVRSEGQGAAWGMKCGREYGDRRKKLNRVGTQLESRVLTRQQTPEDKKSSRGTVGLAEALYHREYNLLWQDLLTRLGFQVVIASQGRKHLTQGKPLVNSDFCAPIILAHGALKSLADKKIDALFFPSVLQEQDSRCAERVPFRSKTTDCYYCYYSQYAPTLLANLTALALQDKLVAPLLSFAQDPPAKIAAQVHQSLSRRFPSLSLQEVTNAYEAAWENYQAHKKGLRTHRPELLAQGLNLVLVGRPYVVFEQALSLGIPELLEEKGARLFWQDEFAWEDIKVDLPGALQARMHWSYGKKILALAELAASTPNLFLVYLSCFRCSPDSFLLNYVKEILDAKGKPFLILQLDEHSSDVGYTTRIEAALRTFESYSKASRKPLAVAAKLPEQNDQLAPGDTVLIPYINRLLSSFWAECFRLEGHPTHVLDNNEKVIHTGYRFANGGECMPAVAIAGGAICKIQEERLQPETTFLYLPTVCMACNFPQFPHLAALALRGAGIRGAKVPSINFLNPGDSLPGALSLKLFETSILASLIYKLFHRVKPYEREAGATDRALDQSEQILLEALRKREGLRRAFTQVGDLFRNVEQRPGEPRKPRIGLLGDLYVKYNDVVNQQVTALVEELGGELVIPSLTDMTCHFLDVDARAGLEKPNAVKTLQTIEGRYEKVVADLIGDNLEPEWDSCVKLLEERGISPEIAGETSINVGRALYLLTHKSVEAIIHLNPMFCCPGVVTASLFRRLQADFRVPIIDLFYDGTGDPNSILVPHLAHLRASRGM